MDADPGAGEGLHEPLPRALRARLRRAVVEHARRTGRSRRLRPVLHVGDPAGVHLRLRVDDVERGDPGLRTDLMATLLGDPRLIPGVGDRAGECSEPLVWLTRAGDLGMQDVDLRWLAAARGASLEAGRPLTMVVVTRRGWCDPRTGLSREWVRLRLTPGPG